MLWTAPSLFHCHQNIVTRSSSALEEDLVPVMFLVVSLHAYVDFGPGMYTLNKCHILGTLLGGWTCKGTGWEKWQTMTVMHWPLSCLKDTLCNTHLWHQSSPRPCTVPSAWLPWLCYEVALLSAFVCNTAAWTYGQLRLLSAKWQEPIISQVLYDEALENGRISRLFQGWGCSMKYKPCCC